MNIGITGNIASGKSEVERIIKDFGYKTICADKIVHKLYTKPNIQEKIYELFGTIDRNEISPIVFSDEIKKQKLESILHPLAEKEILSFFKKNASDKLVFAFVPLLFESNMEKLFDKIIFISSPEDVRLNRIIARDNIDKNLAAARIKSQKPEEEKIPKSDFVINNNSDILNIEKQVKEILSILCEF